MNIRTEQIVNGKILYSAEFVGSNLIIKFNFKDYIIPLLTSSLEYPVKKVKDKQALKQYIIDNIFEFEEGYSEESHVLKFWDLLLEKMVEEGEEFIVCEGDEEE